MVRDRATKVVLATRPVTSQKSSFTPKDGAFAMFAVERRRRMEAEEEARHFESELSSKEVETSDDERDYR